MSVTHRPSNALCSNIRAFTVVLTPVTSTIKTPLLPSCSSPPTHARTHTHAHASSSSSWVLSRVSSTRA